MPKRSPLHCVQDALIGTVMRDFRRWMMAETEHADAWKARPLNESVAGCKARMIDDVEAMLADWRKNQNADKPGTSAFLPVALLATAAVTMPPDLSQLVGIPYWLDVAIPGQAEGEEHKVKMRTIPLAVRAQVVYFSTNPHDASSFANQFAAYMTDDANRRFDVLYELGGGVVDAWPMTVFENSLMPDSAQVGESNLSVVTVDFTMAGLVPQVIGLRLDADGNPVGPDQTTDPDTPRPPGLVVTDVDVLDPPLDRHTHVHADPETGAIDVTEVTP